MIDLEGMTTQEKLDRLEHIITQLEDMLEQCDVGEPIDDFIRDILEGEPWGKY